MREDATVPLDWNHYFTLDEINRILLSFSTRYPDVCRVVELGRTPNNYYIGVNLPINALFIGDVGVDILPGLKSESTEAASCFLLKA
jgi:hypothetical protein